MNPTKRQSDPLGRSTTRHRYSRYLLSLAIAITGSVWPIQARSIEPIFDTHDRAHADEIVEHDGDRLATGATNLSARREESAGARRVLMPDWAHMTTARMKRGAGLDGVVGALAPLAASAACGDTFGESRLSLLATADASVLWERQFDVERVYVPSATAEAALLVLGADDCWGRDFVSEYDATTGEKLRDVPAPPIGAPVSYDPPASCQSLRERVRLSNGDQVDICEQEGVQGGALFIQDAATGALRATLPNGEGFVALRVAGDYLFVRDELARTVDVVALERGAVAWRWESTEDFTVLGADAERAYFWEYDRDVHALALADASPVWRQRLSCNWITLTGDKLACDQILRQSSCRDTDRLWYLGPSRP